MGHRLNQERRNNGRQRMALRVATFNEKGAALCAKLAG